MMTLLSCLAVPFDCLNVVYRDSVTISIQLPEIILSFRIALLSGLAVPFGGLGVVLGDTPTMAIHETKIMLGFTITLLSGLSEFAKRCLVVSAIISYSPVLIAAGDRRHSEAERE
jgi:hypothetical protein